MKQSLSFLTRDWNPGRWIRLVAGIAFLGVAIHDQDGLIGMISGLLLLQAIANVGCCGSSSCGSGKCS